MVLIGAVVDVVAGIRTAPLILARPYGLHNMAGFGAFRPGA
ncbi:hypothetical protein AB0C40_15375 [Streptomyces brevispora]